MKKLIIAFVALFTMTVTTSAMSYEQAREQALFLTDKMAYELNLTEAQYEAAYEVNLDYLMGVNTYDDVYGTYWTRRNLDLSYILLDWQYQAFVNATYFYRPLWWEGGYWHFGIYARYPHRDYFYFGRPGFYLSYRGGHSWHHNGGRSWYHGREFAGPGPQHGRQNGMRDGFQRGDYRGGQTANRSFGNGQRPNTNHSYGNNAGIQRPNTGMQRPNTGIQQQPQRNNSQSTFGGARNNNRQSSTRTTVTRPQNSNTPSFGNSRNTTPRQSFTPRQSQSSPSRSSVSTPSRSSGSFGGSRSGSMSGGSRSGGSFGGGHSAGGSHSGGGSFGGRR